MTHPVLSIIIPTHARRERLRETLELLPTLPGPTREIIVIDDASTDGTREMLKGFPDVRSLRNETPQGFEALPEAVGKARGIYVFQLDDDAYPAEETFERVVAHFEARGPRLGLVALPFVEPRSNRRSYTPYLPEPAPGQTWSEARGFHAGAVVFRREALLRIPPSPPGYVMYETELPTTIEFLSRGWEADYLPDAPVYHLWDARTTGVGRRAAYLPLRNDLVTIKRYYRGWRRREMLLGRFLTGFFHLAAAGHPGDVRKAVREAEAMLASRPERRVRPEVLARVYPGFDGLTLATLFSETNRRRVGWFLGQVPIDQTC